MANLPAKGGDGIKLPQIANLTGNMLDQLTAVLGVDRTVVATVEQIEEAWSRSPRLIRRIPPALRDENIVKTCIAIASGLFDAAINYVWNAAIMELREKVRRFGLHVIPQILNDKSFDEGKLLDLKGSELLELCLKLNLIDEQDYFFLDQCRATRNSYSVAHPPDGVLDEDEVLNFISRCQKHSLSSAQNPRGVDTRQLLSALESSKFKKAQREEWEGRIRSTSDAQRELIFGMLHGIYCDSEAGEEARVNALSLCKRLSDELTPKAQSALIDQHQDYRAKGDEERHSASLQFFEKLGLLSLLEGAELHSLITTASRNLLRVHNDWNNFYNEPPFAERLEAVTKSVSVPESAQEVFVEAVITAGVGNIYGVSNAAMPNYRAMVRSFSPREIRIMLSLPKAAGMVASRIKSSTDCKDRFRALVGLLDEDSVPTSARTTYKNWCRRS